MDEFVERVQFQFGPHTYTFAIVDGVITHTMTSENGLVEPCILHGHHTSVDRMPATSSFHDTYMFLARRSDLRETR